jgi:DNA repair exonuclease SbcCD nuclease subunit
MAMTRMLHTSDVQLGAPFHFLGDKGESHRRQLRDTFRRIVDLALEGSFDLLLIAGDLFDSNRPHQATVDFVASQLGRLEVPVCILPGNHDCYDDASVYRRARFPTNVIVFTEQPTVREFSDLDLAVYGNPTLSRQTRSGPLQGLVRSGTMRWHVALAHGSVVRPDIPDAARPIRPEEIRACGMDYVALGDWHAFADYTQGEVKAFYPGAPEPTSVDQDGAGYVICVELGERGVVVRQERVGSISTGGIEIDVTAKSTAQIRQEIEARADPNLMLTVGLGGLAELGTVLDAERLEQDLAPLFYHLECADRSHPQLAAISPDDYPEELVTGRFVRLMQARIESAAGDADRRVAERALQLGVALLQGRRVL